MYKQINICIYIYVYINPTSNEYLSPNLRFFFSAEMLHSNRHTFPDFWPRKRAPMKPPCLLFYVDAIFSGSAATVLKHPILCHPQILDGLTWLIWLQRSKKPFSITRWFPNQQGCIFHGLVLPASLAVRGRCASQWKHYGKPHLDQWNITSCMKVSWNRVYP